ncbi:MAG TPA: helix-turn-helix domain-containing protein [Blastocatellia bacterium]|nr:helix-turn-helix domain-containing protein [Blastocatellia bacterium]
MYKQEKDDQDRKRLQALWLLRQGRLVKEVAEIVGVHFGTVREWGNVVSAGRGEGSAGAPSRGLMEAGNRG